MDTKEIKNIARKYYKYIIKLDNLEKIDKFIETQNLPKLNQDESENLSRQITPSEIKAIINKLPKNKSCELDSFTSEFYQSFKEEHHLSFSNNSKNFNRREDYQAHFEGQH